jgi:hypothetical protein
MLRLRLPVLHSGYLCSASAHSCPASGFSPARQASSSGRGTIWAAGTLAHRAGYCRLSGTSSRLDLIHNRIANSGVLGFIPNFPHRERRVDLELVETRTFSSRVVYLHYRVAR